MTLKVLQIVGAAAVVILVLLLIPILWRLRRTMDEVGGIISDGRPQAIMILKKAQSTLDSVNKELESVEEITEETYVLVEKAGEASAAVYRAIKSPLSRMGLITAGITVAGFAAKRRLSRDLSGKR